MVRPADRHFRWVSSVQGPTEVLEELDDEMSQFYSTEEGRSDYQDMLGKVAGSNLSEESPDFDIGMRLSELEPDSVLEVGCGNGRLYRHLRQLGYDTNYCGVEVAEHVIDMNAEMHREVAWREGNAYDLPVPKSSMDVVLSLFVLEHLVYPVQGLEEMLRVAQPDGVLLLVFPDFTISGRLASQKLGFSVGTARQKLARGQIIDAVVSLIDSRIRLPWALRNVRDWVGPFPINTRPLCLSEPNHMQPDVDAVYIASQNEVQEWAEGQGHRVRYPFDDTDRYQEVAFMEIVKTT